MVKTTRCSVISLIVRVLGTDTSIPDCNTGAVIMKMISSTSTTSTSGVTLISASEVRVWPVLPVKATFHRLSWRIGGRFGSARRSGSTLWYLFHRVQQFTAKVIRGRCKYPNPSRELVVSNQGGNGHKQSGGGGDQCL